MKKILSGSIVKNPTDLQAGSVIDQIIDRGAILYSQIPVFWDGASIQSAGGTIELQMENPDGSFAINSLPAGVYALANDQLLIARASRTAGLTTLVVGTYPNLNAGEYAIVALASQNAIDLQRKDHFVLFRRRDTTSGIQELIVPLNKQVVSPGAQIPIGSFPYVMVVDYVDSVSTVLPTGATVTIDGFAGVNGDRVLFTNLLTGNHEVYVLGGVGTAITWTPINGFQNGAIPLSGDQIKVLKGIGYASQLGIFNGTTWNFGDVTRFFSAAGDYWEQTSLRTTPIVDGATNVIFSVPVLSTENMIVNYSITRGNLKETGQFYVTSNGLTAAIAGDSVSISDTGVSFSATLVGPNIVVSYTATSLGQAGTMRYFVQRWSDIPGGVSGIPAYTAVLTIPIGYLNSAYAQSDGSAIANNCDEPTVVASKTRLHLHFAYTMAVNAGTTAGDLEVILDGEVLPRYLPGVTVDAYYTEVDNQTIQLDQNYSSPAVSIEVRRKAGTVDTMSTNAAKIAAMFDAVVGSPAQVLQGVANYSSINTAIQSSLAGANILILNGSYVEAVVVDREIVLNGKGHGVAITGTLDFTSGAMHSLVKNIFVTGNITFDAGSTGNYLSDSWQSSASTVTDSGTSNIYTVTDG
jgi:hypothetical protein